MKSLCEFADRSAVAALVSREGSLGGYSSAVTGSEGWGYRQVIGEGM